MAEPSRKQIEANRRNAEKSTGPRTEPGKARSRRNGLRHGLAAEVLVPEEDRLAYEAALARWEREAGPDNVVEEHLVRRAAIASVNLDRIERTKQETREESAREAVGQWERRMQARARRKAQGLFDDPGGVVADLEATAFGCEWLIRQWLLLDAPLGVGQVWDQRTLMRAQRLLGLPEGMPDLDSEPIVRKLWLFAGAAAPTRVTALPRLKSEALFPTDPAIARGMLRRFVAEQVERLEALRDESWEAIEGPERTAIARRAAAADVSKDGQLRHRYESAADRSCNAAIRLYLNLRDRRRRELLEIARETSKRDLPRVPVGNGWWREVDSKPAPPGFARIVVDPTADTDPTPQITPTAADPTHAETPALGSITDPGPTNAVADDPTAAVRRAEPSPHASDPIGTGTAATGPDRPDDPRAESPGAPRRSEPISPADPATNPYHNPILSKSLRNDESDRSSGVEWRTEPFPIPTGRAEHPPTGPSRSRIG